MTKLLGLLIAGMFVFAISASSRAQESAPAARWEGNVIRMSADSIDVREVSGKAQTVKTIHFDAKTSWVSQAHGDKTVNKITAADVKEGDRVICVGTYNDKKEFVATSISKRLSHSPQ
jgi:hypothetical protein